MSAPKHYPVERKKGGMYVVTGEGPHPVERGIPLTVFLREVTGFADNRSEAEEILNSRNLKVNGRVRTDPRYTVGFMDVISIDKVDKSYRALKKGKDLIFKEVSDSDTRLYQVRDKTTLKGGRTQLNLDSGENTISDGDAEEYPTYGTVVVDLDSGEIKDYIGLEKGNLAYITEGKHAGETASIKDKEVVRGSQSNKVVLESSGEEFETVEDHVFVVGEKDPEVEL